MKPKVITICGSSRYVEIMAVVGWLLEKEEGAIVMGLHLLPWWYQTKCADHVAEKEGVASKMDELHFRKIDISDEVFVVNWRGYVGDSTRNEIAYAEKAGKTVRYITDENYNLKITSMLIEADNESGLEAELEAEVKAQLQDIRCGTCGIRSGDAHQFFFSWGKDRENICGACCREAGGLTREEILDLYPATGLDVISGGKEDD